MGRIYPKTGNNHYVVEENELKAEARVRKLPLSKKKVKINKAMQMSIPTKLSY